MEQIKGIKVTRPSLRPNLTEERCTATALICVGSVTTLVVRAVQSFPDKKSCNPLKSDVGTLHVHACSFDFMRSQRDANHTHSAL